ncbi:MAG: HU family DNA-binding protein [Clostridium sp.]|nr:HU family DNA-binding protein [Clostridium sp.]
MAMNYVVTKRVFGFDETKSEKYVVRPVSSGEVSFEKLCTQVSQICGAHRGVVQQVIAGLVDAMINNLDDGKSVCLGEFGLFRSTLHARAAERAEDANANSVYRKRIHFTPGSAFKSALNQVSVTRYAEPDTDWTDGSSRGGSTSPGDGNNGNGGEESNILG